MSDDYRWEGGSPWLFLVGLLLFLGSGLLFLTDLIRGVDVLRGIAANAAGAALLMAWAAYDTLFDPDSEVATRGGAAGTALLLYGLYLLIAGVVIGATGLLFHEYAALGPWYLGLAVVAVVVGFSVFPTEAVVERNRNTGNSETGTGDQKDEENRDSGGKRGGAAAASDDGAGGR
jgi:F0F1-type ATP synthase assembly protein I